MRPIALVVVLVAFMLAGCKDAVSGRAWVREFSGVPGYEIEFFRGGKFRAIALAEGVYVCSAGRYTLKGNDIKLASTCCAQEGDRVGLYTCSGHISEKRDPFRERACRIAESAESLRFGRYLDCGEGLRFWDSASVLPIGTVRKVGSVSFKVSGYRDARTTAELRLRSGPSTRAPVVALLRPGGDLRIIGETLVAEVQHGKKAPWLYVEADIDTHWERGWVFGSFVTAP